MLCILFQTLPFTYLTFTIFVSHKSVIWHNFILHSSVLHHEYLWVYISAKNGSVVKTIPEMYRKKYRKAEYVQRRVCFVNEQVPWPHSNINVKFCTSRLCMKMLSFLFVYIWAMPRILYLSCGIPFSVRTPDNISDLTSVVVWLSRWEVIKPKIR